MGHMAVVGLGEGELHDHINLCIHWGALLLDLEQVVEWVVQEDVSLDDLVALDVEGIKLQAPDSVIVELLAL